MGLNLDLVDQDAILGPDRTVQPLVDPAEMKFLVGTVDKGRGKLKQIDQSSKPWWLRNTTYMENNLFNAVINKNNDVESTNKYNEAKRKQIGDSQDPFNEHFIDNSFKLLDQTIRGLADKAGKKRRIVWEVPVLPLDLPTQFVPVSDKSYSLVRFDEDPLANITGEENTAEGAQGSSTKRRRVNSSIVTNIRQSSKNDQFAKTAAIEVSLVAPVQERASEAQASAHYDWVKDYRMEVQDSRVEDCFMLLVNERQLGANGENGAVSHDAAARYFQIRSRVDMKKMNVEDSQPHEARVSRRREDADLL